MIGLSEYGLKCFSLAFRNFVIQVIAKLLTNLFFFRSVSFTSLEKCRATQVCASDIFQVNRLALRIYDAPDFRSRVTGVRCSLAWCMTPFPFALLPVKKM